MKSLESRLEALERAAEEATAEETVVKILLITATTRQQVLALNALHEAEPPDERPQPRGRIRLVPEYTDAKTYLAQHGIVLPPENIETKGNEDNE